MTRSIETAAPGIGAADEPNHDAGVVGELVETLRVIANASERSETAFGGKMSDVTRVFEHITRVARAALAKYATQQGGGAA